MAAYGSADVRGLEPSTLNGDNRYAWGDRRQTATPCMLSSGEQALAISE